MIKKIFENFKKNEKSCCKMIWDVSIKSSNYEKIGAFFCRFSMQQSEK